MKALSNSVRAGKRPLPSGGPTRAETSGSTVNAAGRSASASPRSGENHEPLMTLMTRERFPATRIERGLHRRISTDLTGRRTPSHSAAGSARPEGTSSRGHARRNVMERRSRQEQILPEAPARPLREILFVAAMARTFEDTVTWPSTAERRSRARDEAAAGRAREGPNFVRYSVPRGELQLPLHPSRGGRRAAEELVSMRSSGVDAQGISTNASRSVGSWRGSARGKCFPLPFSP